VKKKGGKKKWGKRGDNRERGGPMEPKRDHGKKKCCKNWRGEGDVNHGARTNRKERQATGKTKRNKNA